MHLNLNLLCFLKFFKAQNCYASQTAGWRLGPEYKGMDAFFRGRAFRDGSALTLTPLSACLPGRCRAQGPCRHIQDIQRPCR